MKHIPIITIIGVPNTGKSTLFNRLTGRRKALVHPEPGMTRDVFRMPMLLDEQAVFLQDSGGFFPDKSDISKEINIRVLREAERSDVVVFLCDGKRELLGYEKDLYLSVRNRTQSVILVVNKIDDPERHIVPQSYYELKAEFLAISAEHDLGINQLRSRLTETIGESVTKPAIEPGNASRISIVGKPNVGKSSLINSILKDDLLIVSPIPGTTRDSIDLALNRNNRDLILVDNAGIRKMQKIHEDTESIAVLRAQKDIHSADIIILVLDASRKIDQNDLFIAAQVLKSTKPVILAANKWDLISSSQAPHLVEQSMRQRLHAFHFAPFHLVSALNGKNVFRLLDNAERIHLTLQEGIRTPILNRAVNSIYAEKRLVTKSGRSFKSKYATIESRRPFFIRLQSRYPEHLKPSDETFLKKRLTEKLDLWGIPIFLKVTASARK
ncbi:MAG: ribosome biogenesis GTPase Der [Candidatus Aminicenantes bacterium]|nr:ribosome biogenesis GTPase Der [Candidatus Aminicenantes bacterium]